MISEHNVHAIASGQDQHDYSGDGTAHDGLLWRKRIGIVKRYKWLIAIGTLTGGVLGFLSSGKTVPTYDATAVLRVNTMPRGAELPGMMPLLDQTDILTQLEILRSRSTARIVADSLDLTIQTDAEIREVISNVLVHDEFPATPFHITFHDSYYRVTRADGDLAGQPQYQAPLRKERMEFTVERRPEIVREGDILVQGLESAAANLVQNLSSRLRPNTEILDLTYTATDPVMAASVVNTLAHFYQSQDNEQSRRQSTARRTFITAQLARADSEFTAARSELESFRRRTGILRSDTELERWHENKLELENERIGLRSDRETLREIIRSVDAENPSDADLQALVYAPIVSDNAMVASLYERYLDLQAERQSVATGRFAEAEESPAVERLNILIRNTAGEIVAAAENLTRILDTRITATEQRLEQARNELENLPGEVSRENELIQKVRASEQLVDDLRKELLRARIAEVIEGGNVEIVDLANVPTTPSGTSNPPKLMLGLLGGIFVGLAAAFFLERLNTTVRDRSDLQFAVPVPNLAIVPLVGANGAGRARWLPTRFFKRRSGRGTPRGSHNALLLEGEESHAALGESYRSLRTNLMFQAHASHLKSMVVTSAKPAEGKTTTAVNLAVVFAQQGARTLLIDGDLRHPVMHAIFGVEREPGLTDAARGSATLDEAVKHTAIEHLSLLPGGSDATYPSELLGSDTFAALLKSATERFDMVIVDSPPVLTFTDAAVLGARVDGVIIVALSNVTERTAAQMAAAHIQSVGAEVLGTVLNGLRPGHDSAYGYSTYEYYSYNGTGRSSRKS